LKDERGEGDGEGEKRKRESGSVNARGTIELNKREKGKKR